MTDDQDGGSKHFMFLFESTFDNATSIIFDPEYKCFVVTVFLLPIAVRFQSSNGYSIWYLVVEAAVKVILKYKEGSVSLLLSYY